MDSRSCSRNFSLASPLNTNQGRLPANSRAPSTTSARFVLPCFAPTRAVPCAGQSTDYPTKAPKHPETSARGASTSLSHVFRRPWETLSEDAMSIQVDARYIIDSNFQEGISLFQTIDNGCSYGGLDWCGYRVSSGVKCIPFASLLDQSF